MEGLTNGGSVGRSIIVRASTSARVMSPCSQATRARNAMETVKPKTAPRARFGNRRIEDLQRLLVPVGKRQYPHVLVYGEGVRILDLLQQAALERPLRQRHRLLRTADEPLQGCEVAQL